LSKEQKEAFKTMKNAFVADLKKADQEGVKISAVNAADKVNKLRQILCGTVMGPDGEYVTLPHGPRTQVLIETIELASAKVLVIVPFKGIIRDLETELTKKGYSVGVLNGDVSITERSNIITAFKTRSDPHVLLCHPRVMAHGLNLVEADTTIFYGPIFSNDEYQQVIERFNRMGQVNPMTIYRIGAHPIEWEIYKTLDERGKMQDTVLNMYRDMLAMET
jgi:SNF2 family DNA or RNA helicase